MNYIYGRIKKLWHYMLLDFIAIYRILSLGFRMNFSFIILCFQAYSALADSVLRSKGQTEVCVLIYLVPWCLGITYYSFMVQGGFLSFFILFGFLAGRLLGFFLLVFFCVFVFVCWFGFWFCLGCLFLKYVAAV